MDYGSKLALFVTITCFTLTQARPLNICLHQGTEKCQKMLLKFKKILNEATLP